MIKTYRCYNIVLDVTNDEEDYEDLPVVDDYENFEYPETIDVEVDDEGEPFNQDDLEESLADNISDTTGYCVQSFEYKELGENGELIDPEFPESDPNII